MTVPPRVAPRRLAPVVFGLVDVALGVPLIVDRTAAAAAAPAYATLVWLMPMPAWGLLFIAVGVLVLAGAARARLGYVGAFAGVALWTTWALLCADQVDLPTVTARAVVSPLGYAALHSLLVPYRRRPRM